MHEELNVGEIIQNAITVNEQANLKHVLSGIDANEVLVLTDETNTLRIYTQESDILNLSLSNDSTDTIGEWKQLTPNDSDDFATYVSTSDETIKLLIDENVVEPL